MKLSILTTITNPQERQDPYEEAIESYCDLADEVVIVDGSLDCPSKPVTKHKTKVICNYWPYDWSWEKLPKQLNEGLFQCTGDWVIKLDIDQMFHEDSIKPVRKILTEILSTNPDIPIVTFQKFSLYPFSKYRQKGAMAIAINLKTYRKDIAFGIDKNKITDLCYPIKVEGIDSNGVFYGKLLENTDGYKSGLPFWNFDYTFKTQQLVQSEFFRFSQAYYRFFKVWKWGQTEEESFDIFINMMKGRLKSCPYVIKDFNKLPKYIRHKVKNLKPEQFGYNGWGKLI